jgi:alkylation response protein AidB-like acyl-CoA dehydrogenase
MDTAMRPMTAAGTRFCELAELHAKEAAEAAPASDREGTFPVAVFESMKASGFLGATVPEEFGGGGLTSALDLAAGMSRLGRGDGSTAIAANMHLVFGLIAGRALRGAREVADERTSEQMSAYLSILGAGTIGAANATEPGTDLRHPLVEGVEVDGGWSLTGRKIFGTLSPIADLFFVPFRAGGDRSGYAIVPRGSAGQTILDNWDALGMRGSGSNDIVYESCFVPADFVDVSDQWGEESPMSLVIGTVGNIGLLGAFLGIAEAARDHAVHLARTRTKAPSGRPLAERHGIQHQVADMEIDLETCRAVIERAGRLLDEQLFERSPNDVSVDELHELSSTFQCAKLVANRKAIEVVDRALTVSGGAGYLTASPLSRLYRDVRAGPFMQPFSPNEVHEYVGKVTLGLPPDLEG